ncbi:MAG: PfkB family carbohydrate kinase [Acidimicrobiales bacterium]|nr:PfkB family carbohydrate kinase [Acidimicrobiales bacterium]HJO79754.1 PfkB family carbohydrate kinase [Acidimicrobiales bacterium]
MNNAIDVVVVGTVSTDEVFDVPTLPSTGETVAGVLYQSPSVGKAANMAVSAAAHSVTTSLVAAVSNDLAGDEAIAELVRLGVGVADVARVELPMDKAIATSAPEEELLATVPGTSATLTPSHVKTAIGGMFHASAGTCLISGEVNDDVTVAAASAAVKAGLTVLYNTAPSKPPPESLVAYKPIVITNQLESHQLSGLTDPVEAARWLRDIYQVGIVTLGASGIVVSSIDGLIEYSAKVIDVVDTTGAGDAFCGAVAAVLATTQNLGAAVHAGIEAGGRAASHAGARSWVTAG